MSKALKPGVEGARPESEGPAKASSPLLDQYFALKQEASDSLLLFRVGDFYEAYGEDAKLLSRALNILLTGKDVRGNRIPMAGFPYHTLETHLKRLVAQGFKVAISEQLEEANEAKGLIRRDIVRFVTPGTVLEPELLREKEPNYLLAIFPGEEYHGLSWCDISTSVWFTSRIPASRELLQHEILKISPKEILCPHPNVVPAQNVSIAIFQEFDKIPLDDFSSLPIEAAHACQLIQAYLNKVYRGNSPKLPAPTLHESHRYLVLDAPTRRNLELFRNLTSGDEEGSLLHLLDHTKTSMGGRLLRHWLFHPLLEISEIEKRQEAVAEIIREPRALSELQKLLGGIGDLERFCARVSFGTAHARDLLAIKSSLEILPRLLQILSSLKGKVFQDFVREVPDFSELALWLSKALHPDPPLSLKEGGLIRSGFDETLDSLNHDLRDATAWIAELEERERKTTGIKSLKVGFNQVFGYYLEITRSNLSAVPTHYIRKQTLSNAERFIVEELKIQEARILRNQEKCKNLEYELFCSIRDHVKNHVESFRLTASQLSVLDAILSLAVAAQQGNYCRPTVTYDESIHLEAGRHPVVEAGGLEPFVPNDCLLDSTDNRLLIVTGPNMAGKSTYLRQVALCVILAQMGSFVPASRARIGIVDRVFTRIGASDDLHRGQSTFFVEMKETAEILRNATRQSLVLLDEIGRGTSTYDGLSLAWAIAEELLLKNSKVLFATHYHEMTALAQVSQGTKNFSVAVQEQGQEIVFLRRIIPGGSDKSYGIHVARLAGIPESALGRANQILKELEARDIGKKMRKESKNQLSFL